MNWAICLILITALLQTKYDLPAYDVMLNTMIEEGFLGRIGNDAFGIMMFSVIFIVPVLITDLALGLGTLYFILKEKI